MLGSSSVDAEVKTDSDYVNEVSVSCGCFKSYVSVRGEEEGRAKSEYTHQNKGGPNEYMESVESRSNKECSAVDSVRHGESCADVLVDLASCEQNPEEG